MRFCVQRDFSVAAFGISYVIWCCWWYFLMASKLSYINCLNCPFRVITSCYFSFLEYSSESYQTSGNLRQQQIWRILTQLDDIWDKIQTLILKYIIHRTIICKYYSQILLAVGWFKDQTHTWQSLLKIPIRSSIINSGQM